MTIAIIAQTDQAGAKWPEINVDLLSLSDHLASLWPKAFRLITMSTCATGAL